MKSKNSSREICKEKRQDDTLWTVGAEAWYPNELKKISTKTNTDVTTLISADI